MASLSLIKTESVTDLGYLDELLKACCPLTDLKSSVCLMGGTFCRPFKVFCILPG